MYNTKQKIMKRRQILKSGVTAGAIAVGATTPVTAGPPPGHRCKLEGRENLAYNGGGEQIINVTRKVINGLDTGHCEPWARDTFQQRIQVWDEGDQFVAIIKWNGRFDAFAGVETPAEPCDGTTLDGDESGPFDGGVRLTFEGTFNPNGSQTHGHLGTVDQGCVEDDGDGDPPEVEDCDFSSTTGWMNDYFDSVSNLAFPWFGFIYHGGRDGTWVNSSEGDCGNIT